MLIGPHATEQQLDDARATIEAEPRNWIVQEVVQLSTLPSPRYPRSRGNALSPATWTCGPSC